MTIIAHRRCSYLVYHPWTPFSYQHVSVGYVLDSSVLVGLPVALGRADADRVGSATLSLARTATSEIALRQKPRSVT